MLRRLPAGLPRCRMAGTLARGTRRSYPSHLSSHIIIKHLRPLLLPSPAAASHRLLRFTVTCHRCARYGVYAGVLRGCPVGSMRLPHDFPGLVVHYHIYGYHYGYKFHRAAFIGYDGFCSRSLLPTAHTPLLRIGSGDV